ncbi:MAG: tetratricopeptide repeat protein [bacterium]|jgi:tetratricopeptide (TPR) repeat protein|nr:tetratricopeptide repeat protein [bacterium]
MKLLRIWNWAGGDLPGGVLPLVGALLLWGVLVQVVIRPIGVFRDRSPLPWLAAGWLLIVSIHVLLRLQLSAPPPAGLLLWPPEERDSPVGEAVFARAEQNLRPPAASGTLRWQGKPLPLRIVQHLLETGRTQPASEAEAARLMAALDVRLLVSQVGAQDRPHLVLWRWDWRVCTREGGEPCPHPDRPDSLAAALDRLLARHVEGAVLERRPWDASWRILYQPVPDSAQAWLDLPTGPLPPWEDLRRSSLQLALAGPLPEVAEGVNRALAWAAERTELGAEPWLLASAWFARTGEWEQARQALANALSREPGHPLIYWQLAHMAKEGLAAFGYPDKATARSRCLDLLPAFRPAVLVQANHWMNHRQGLRAVALAEAALTAYPRDAELHLLRGNLAYELMDHEQALASYQASLAVRPDDPRAWLNLGQLHIILNHWAEAVPALERAVALGSPPTVLHLLGLSHLRQGRPEVAVQYLEKRLALGGDPVDLAQSRRLLEQALAMRAPDEAPSP